MLIESLTLRHFRNYEEVTIPFAAGGAYITGPNGSGKTNLLEAIYVLANQTSFRTSRREELQGWSASQCAISATIKERETERCSELAIRLGQQGRRLYLNGKETRNLQKFTAHFAAVAFHPGSMQIIKGGPAGRRYLVDRGIASLQPEFLSVSQKFQRSLKQRNALVRSSTSDLSTTLATWNEHFIQLAVSLTHYRRDHIVRLNHTLSELVKSLGEDLGTLVVDYRPAVLAGCSAEERQAILMDDTSGLQLRQCFMAEAERLRRAEEAVGQTLFGPQRDDFVIRYSDRESRGYASQGEQRLAAFLLIAALAIDIHRYRGHRPVVLLDDIVSEFDERNRMVIFDFLKTHAFQVFITDVEERLVYRSVSPLTSLRVRQVDGYAKLQVDCQI
jgi:DNA replication and repair protein RecF